MTIRPAVAGDEAAILAIRNDPEALFWSASYGAIDPLAQRLWFQTLLRDPTHGMWVAEESDGQVIGYGRTKIRSVGTVSFGVDKNHRGRGVGTELLQVVDRWAKVLRVDQQAWVHPSNIASVRAFLKLGYRLGGEPAYQLLEKRSDYSSSVTSSPGGRPVHRSSLLTRWRI